MGSAIHLSRCSSVQVKPLAPSFFMPAEYGIIGDARRFPPDNAVELRSDAVLGAWTDLMASAHFAVKAALPLAASPAAEAGAHT